MSLESAKWQLHNDGAEPIASIMLSGIEVYVEAVERLFVNDEPVPYSGIILVGDEKAADGEKVEKACYHKGGYRFLYRSYADEGIETNAPVADMAILIEGLADAYLANVVGVDMGPTRLESCWAVCQREGDYATLHNHISPVGFKGRRYSGMFYLKSPPAISPDNFPNGCLHLVTPDQVIYIPPIPGSLVLWSSQLIHGVHPFRGAGDRLGIAFNVVTD